MGTETIIFSNISPPPVNNCGTFVFRTDPVFPMIRVGKTSSRPTEVGNVQVFQGDNNIVADSGSVRHFCIAFSNIKSAIDTSSEMLGKMTVDVFTDLVCTPIGMYDNLILTECCMHAK